MPFPTHLIHSSTSKKIGLLLYLTLPAKPNPKRRCFHSLFNTAYILLCIQGTACWDTSTKAKILDRSISKNNEDSEDSEQGNEEESDGQDKAKTSIQEKNGKKA